MKRQKPLFWIGSSKKELKALPGETPHGVIPAIAKSPQAQPLARRLCRWLFLLAIVVMPHAGLAESTALEKITLLALAPLDARAVVKLPSGRLLTVKPGDKLPETQATVQAVLSDKLVLVEPAQAGNPTSGRQVWLHKATAPGEMPSIQYLERTPPPDPSIQKPWL